MPRIVDKAEMRASIYRACSEEMARNGYEATTMRDLARRAGCSTGTLYHYFSAKDELFASMLEYYSQTDVDQALQKIQESSQPLDALQDFVRNSERHFQNLLLLAVDFARSNAANSGNAGNSSNPLEKLLRKYEQAIAEHVTQSDEDAAHRLLASIIGELLLKLVLGPVATEQRELAEQKGSFKGENS